MLRGPLFCILASAVIALSLDSIGTYTSSGRINDGAAVIGPIKEVPQNLKLYDDKNILCLEDIAKAAPIDWLAIPKSSYTDFSDFTDSAFSQEIAIFFSTVAKILKDHGLDEIFIYCQSGLTKLDNLAKISLLYK